MATIRWAVVGNMVGNAVLVLLVLGAVTAVKLILAEPGGPGLVLRAVTELALAAAPR
ncbi:hypothetical protein [Amycolatopsis albispora]|uniref:hypothetical protein n=1 Tax=Amycolatopsis albispora TaxID=1804986 RepID=UPI0013B3CD8E|nr:hypothetical protein [Amycolatopsis albispora]